MNESLFERFVVAVEAIAEELHTLASAHRDVAEGMTSAKVGDALDAVPSIANAIAEVAANLEPEERRGDRYVGGILDPTKK